MEERRAYLLPPLHLLRGGEKRNISSTKRTKKGGRGYGAVRTLRRGAGRGRSGEKKKKGGKRRKKATRRAVPVWPPSSSTFSAPVGPLAHRGEGRKGKSPSSHQGKREERRMAISLPIPSFSFNSKHPRGGEKEGGEKGKKDHPLLPF